MINMVEAQALVRRTTRLLTGQRQPVVDVSREAQLARVAQELAANGLEVPAQLTRPSHSKKTKDMRTSQSKLHKRTTAEG
jgi:hypothetical protein